MGTWQLCTATCDNNANWNALAYAKSKPGWFSPTLLCTQILGFYDTSLKTNWKWWYYLGTLLYWIDGIAKSHLTELIFSLWKNLTVNFLNKTAVSKGLCNLKRLSELFLLAMKANCAVRLQLLDYLHWFLHMSKQISIPL